MSDARLSLKDRMTLVAEIVRDAGGTIVGRTRLQKSVFLLSLAGFEQPFRFGYKHYGPFSESLADAVDLAVAFDLISEELRPNSWGGTYSIYSVKDTTETETETETETKKERDARVRLLQEAAGSNPILLELAATAGYLSKEESSKEPWAKTARLKPDKSADGRLEFAKNLYLRLRAASDGALPEIGSA
ncbi:MAG: hypothetical protein ABR878_17000 [Roseiarcus sp.]